MAEQINLASLIISIIILIVVVILIFMVCYYYTNNNSTQSVQNPQALAAAALYKNANKNNFAAPYAGANDTCDGALDGVCCLITSDHNGVMTKTYGNCQMNACNRGYAGYGCNNL